MSNSALYLHPFYAIPLSMDSSTSRSSNFVMNCKSHNISLINRVLPSIASSIWSSSASSSWGQVMYPFFWAMFPKRSSRSSTFDSFAKSSTNQEPYDEFNERHDSVWRAICSSVFSAVCKGRAAPWGGNRAMPTGLGLQNVVLTFLESFEIQG